MSTLQKFATDKPLVLFDLEATTVKPATARIVEISLLKINTDGTIETKSSYIDPECDIPVASSDVHGITNEKIAELKAAGLAPKFSQIAKSLAEWIGDANLGGYSSDGYDIPLLIESFLRCGVDFSLSGRITVDACTIFKKKEERTLSAALRFFTGEELVDAHTAAADVVATAKVLLAETEYYPDLKYMSIEQLAEYCKYDGPEKIDLSGVFLKDADGEAIYAFGKHQHEKVKSCPVKYLQWLMGDANYTLQTKKVAEELYNTYFKK